MDQIGLTDGLAGFFSRFRQHLGSKALIGPHPQPLELNLSKLFDNLRSCVSRPTPGYASGRPSYLDNPAVLESWLSMLRPAMEDARQGGILCDPWRVAGLRRDEVRNSGVLAWLLDPRGSHGFGDRMLQSMLAEIHFRKPGLLPERLVGLPRVKVESNPDGDLGNRVDLEISAVNFYLLIEVKIDAAEGPAQMERYGCIAEIRAREGNRMWGMIFLTRQGQKSITAKDFSDKVVPISWRDLASILGRSLGAKRHASSSHDRFTERLAKTFLRHVRNF